MCIPIVHLFYVVKSCAKCHSSIVHEEREYTCDRIEQNKFLVMTYDDGRLRFIVERRGFEDGFNGSDSPENTVMNMKNAISSGCAVTCFLNACIKGWDASRTFRAQIRKIKGIDYFQLWAS